MFKIKVIAPITSWNIDCGYFTGCYRARGDDGIASTWIGYSDRSQEQHLHKVYKTKKQAENKIKFLKQKQDENGYMCNWIFEIEEFEEDN